jgi:hypothetical protein
MSADQFEAAAATVTAAADVFQTAADPERRQRELTELMAPYGETGPWRFAPAAERQRASDAVRAEQDQRAGVALHGLSTTIDELEANVVAAIEAAAAAPDAEQAWTQRTKQQGITADQLLQLGVLDELRQARFEREFAAAAPTVMLARYQRALLDGSEQANASAIRWIEARHATWSWPASLTDTEQAAVTTLQKAVAKAREARVPATAKAAREALQRAKKLRQRAKDIDKIAPRRPQ